ncbi:MAG: LuxR C-terminal-related transcriptional regulator [Gammaproteobacteria bacterium]|nr:LuxR C-terminal-related transcriptional regulator [Gammaproteobacteria bacterium]
MPSIQLKDIYLVLFFLVMMLASGIDLILDFMDGVTFIHAAHEVFIVVFSLIALAWLLFDIRRQANEIQELRRELSTRHKPKHSPEKYILEARSSLGSVINKQFDDWGLSNSEKEVGRLLLKGLSLKEIAAVRNTLEKTVRQQASAIYKKADLTGRHAFSAWFLEDIL